MVMMPFTHCGGGAAIQTAHDMHARRLVRDQMMSRVAVRPEAVDGTSERRCGCILKGEPFSSH